MQTSSQRGARLISAAGRGDIESVRTYIEDSNMLRTQDDETGLFPGWTPLHWAARNGHIEIVRLLLDEGDRTGSGEIPLVSIVDGDGDTALHVAVSWGQQTVVDLLFDRGGSLIAKNNDGKSPLDLASTEFRGHLAAVAGLTGPGGDVEKSRRHHAESQGNNATSTTGARKKLM
mmetsp:Transcript_11183/g.22140  ORF Transcript_11183/g.22140 Transcript_11183/m.22140 type:complete len:174 (+) Transcript_11183:215-736(+)